jgi:hypothetical protein
VYPPILNWVSVVSCEIVSVRDKPELMGIEVPYVQTDVLTHRKVGEHRGARNVAMYLISSF